MIVHRNPSESHSTKREHDSTRRGRGNAVDEPRKMASKEGSDEGSAPREADPLASVWRGIEGELEGAGRDDPRRLASVGFAGLARRRGASTLSLAYARAIASPSEPVLLCDLNWIHPCLHEMAGVNLQPGLDDVLERGVAWTSVLRGSDYPGIWILSTGGLGEAIAMDAARIAALLVRIRREASRFRRLVVDLPSIEESALALSLGECFERLILVAAPFGDPFRAIERVRRVPRSVKARMELLVNQGARP